MYFNRSQVKVSKLLCIHATGRRFLVLPPFVTLCILVDFPIHIDTIRMGYQVLYFKGVIASQVKVSKLLWIHATGRGFLVLPPFVTLCILMDFPIHIDTISMGYPVLYFDRLQVKVSKL